MNLRIITGLFASLMIISSTFAADVDGDWSMAMTAAEGFAIVNMSIAVDGENATASIGTDEFTGTYKNGELNLKGSLYVAEAGMSSTFDMTAKLDGEELNGTGNWDMYALSVKGTRK